VFQHVSKTEKLDRLEGKLTVLKRLAPIVGQMASPVERSLAVEWIADKLRLDQTTVTQEFSRQRKPGSVQEPAAPAVVAEQRPPAPLEEQTLISALLKRPALVDKYRERLEPSFFSDEVLKALLAKMLEAEPVSPDAEEDWTETWIHALPEPIWVETALTLWAESRSGQTEAVVKDCINRLESTWLRTEIRQLQASILEAQQAGEREAFKRLAQREIELKNRLKKMGVDWSGGGRRRG
jgi:DNA primase